MTLERIGSGSQFFYLPQRQWSSNYDFLLGQRRARALSLINNLVERGIALLQDNMKVTKDESQRQFLFQMEERSNAKTTQTNNNNNNNNNNIFIVSQNV